MEDVESKIFGAAIPFEDSEDEQLCREMIDALSEEQLEQAACTSYAYLKASRTASPPSLEVRNKMAMRMARRHLVSEKGDKELALTKMIDTLNFRQAMEINDLREAYCNDEDIINDPVAKGFVVCGYDIDNRAILSRFPKYYETLTTEDAFFKLLLYNLERAIACTERKSIGEQEKIVVAVDLSMERFVAPPYSLMKKIVFTFLYHYPERLHLLVPVDPPLPAWGVINMMMPFLNSDTKEKIKVVSGEVQKEAMLGPRIHEDQSMSFLRVKGKVTSWDCDNYLRDIAFDRAANE